MSAAALPPRRALAATLAAVAGEASSIEAKWLLEAATDAEHLAAMVTRRLAGEPLDRIFGHRGFWTLDMLVTPAVLSPRPDTETIVEAARDHLLKRHSRNAALRILDLGTGSGAILLALLAEFPEATGLGLDISDDALAVAAHNASRNGLDERATFRRGGWDGAAGQRFDLVVSNPPYIPSGDIPGLDLEVRAHDPLLALDGGADGLEAYRAIMPLLPGLLEPHGLAVLEVGQGQAADVVNLAHEAGLDLLEQRSDLGGIVRALVFGAKPQG